MGIGEGKIALPSPYSQYFVDREMAMQMQIFGDRETATLSREGGLRKKIMGHKHQKRSLFPILFLLQILSPSSVFLSSFPNLRKCFHQTN